MKKKIINIAFLFLFITAIFANYRLISGEEGLADIQLFSLTNIASAQTEDGQLYPFYDEACFTCTDPYGQNGIRLLCDFAWAFCRMDMIDCGYGYC